MEKSAVGVGDGGRPDSGSRDSSVLVAARGVEEDGLWVDRGVDTDIDMFVSRGGRREGPAFGPSSTSSGSGVE